MYVSWTSFYPLHLTYDVLLAVFSRALARAKDHGIRVVSLIRRDYNGSTPFSEAELDLLKSTDPASHHQFLRERGLEIARFLVALIDKFDLPPAGKDGKGGLSILGWSLGGTTLFAFAHFFPTYPEAIQERLKKHLKSLVSYGACGICLVSFSVTRTDGFQIRRSMSLDMVIPRGFTLPRKIPRYPRQSVLWPSALGFRRLTPIRTIARGRRSRGSHPA